MGNLNWIYPESLLIELNCVLYEKEGRVVEVPVVENLRVTHK